MLITHVKSPKKINIGCGYDKRPGFLNVDMDPACQPDVLVTGADLSQFERRAFDEMVAHDVLEHIPRAQTASALLEWADILQTEGTLSIRTSDVRAIVTLMNGQQTYAAHAVHTIFMYGNQVHPGDWHHTGFTDLTLRVHLLSAGFEVLDMNTEDGWILVANAKKVADWTALDRDKNLNSKQFVEAACREALLREPEETFTDLWESWLESGAHNRRSLLKVLYTSDERRLRVAAQHGL